jgi:hypothetical protein
MAFFTLLVIGAVCLIFKSTRLIGVIGLTLLLLVFPIVFLLLLIMGCMGLLIQYILNRRNLNVISQYKLPE